MVKQLLIKKLLIRYLTEKMAKKVLPALLGELLDTIQ